MYVCMYVCIYISRRLQLNRSARQTPAPVLTHTHTHRRARWRLCRKHTDVPRSRVSLPNLHRMAMENDRGEELGSSPATLRPSLNAIYFIIPLPLFYSPRREVVITRYIMFILCPFGQRYTSISSLMRVCYLGPPLSLHVPI